MLRQSLAVHALTLEHNRIHFVRWREIQVPFKDQQHAPLTERAAAALDALEAELIKQQRSAAQPRTRRYQLIEKAN